MLETICLIPAVSLPDLSTLYWVCFVVGSALLLFATVGAMHGEADVDTDAGFDTDADFDAGADFSGGADAQADFADGDVDAAGHETAAGEGASSLATWLSVRFLVYFAAVFGLLGVVLTYLTNMSDGAVLATSLVCGVVAGQAVHQLFASLRRSSSNSALGPGEYLGQRGRVTVPIISPRKGEVLLRVRDGERYVTAVARRAGTSFRAGEEVVVVGYSGGVAEVQSREEYDFLNEGKKQADEVRS